MVREVRVVVLTNELIGARKSRGARRTGGRPRRGGEEKICRTNFRRAASVQASV